MSEPVNPASWSVVYNSGVNYSSQAKIEHSLSLYSASDIEAEMTGGWNGSHANYYLSESRIGAYAGYLFSQPVRVEKVIFYLGRYLAQNKTLTATAQYYDGSNWIDVSDMSITTSLSYPISSFTVDYGGVTCTGVRWQHYKGDQKSSGNNITFFGMLVYELPGSGFQIILQQNLSENIRADKELVDVLSMNGVLRHESSMLNPFILVEADPPDLVDVNYLTIPSWGRSYFVREKTVVRNRLVQLTAHADVLSSFRDQLRQNTAIVRRAQSDQLFNMYLNDGSLVAYQDPYILTEPFPDGFDGACFILAVAGG